MPKNCVSVCRPGIFGNPFKVGSTVAGITVMSVEHAVELHRDWLSGQEYLNGIEIEKRFSVLTGLKELHGKYLACFCKVGSPCHRENLLKLANR